MLPLARTNLVRESHVVKYIVHGERASPRCAMLFMVLPQVLVTVALAALATAAPPAATPHVFNVKPDHNLIVRPHSTSPDPNRTSLRRTTADGTRTAARGGAPLLRATNRIALTILSQGILGLQAVHPQPLSPWDHARSALDAWQRLDRAVRRLRRLCKP